MRRFSFFVLLVLCAPPVQAMQQVFLGGRISTNESATAVGYNSPGGGDSWQATQATRQEVTPVTSVWSELRVTITAAPGGGKSRTYVLMDGGSTTAVTCAISGASATTCVDTTNTVSIPAGDLVSVRVTPAGTPTAAASKWTVKSTTPSLVQSSLMGATANVALSTSAVNFIALAGQVSTATEFDNATVMPFAGASKGFYVQISVAAGAGKQYAFDLMKNGLTTGITCTIAGASATTCSDLTNSTALAAGDYLDVRSTPTGTPTAAAAFAGVVIESSTAGDFIIPYVNGNTALINSATNFARPMSAGNSFNVTETNQQQLASVCTIKNTYVIMASAPTGITSYAFNFRKNSASAGPSCTITGTATTCNNATSTTLANADSIATQTVPTSTPAAVNMSQSYTGNVSSSEWTLYGSTIYGATLQ